MGATEGYRIRSPETWARVRRDYATGFTAPEIVARHGLGLSAVRARIRREQWSGPDSEDGAFEDTPDAPDATMEHLADLAWRRMTRAVRAGCVTAAIRWLRLHQQFRHMAALDQAQPDVAASDPAVQTPPELHELHDVRIFSAPPATAAYPARTAPTPPVPSAQSP